MKNLSVKIVVLLSFLISVTSGAAINTEWKKIKNRKNVDVFEGVIPNSPVVAFRGVSEIDAPIGNVVSVIHDVSRIKEWMSDLSDSRVLERKSILEKIEYNHTKTPWPLDDRDFVYSVKVVINKEQKTVDILIENATHPDAPPVKGIVRGTLQASRYYLKSIDNGTRTHIEVEILADPNGNIPKWVVNLFQSAWPSNTIAGIRKIATEPGYHIHPDLLPFISAATTTVPAETEKK